jgi:pyruvate/2-oxoglutarate dehydrogenase complex dihydrolipoamide acyltransferase (E2) component
VHASPLLARYGTPIDRESAREILTAKMNAAAEADAAAEQAKAQEQAAKEQEKQRAAQARRMPPPRAAEGVRPDPALHRRLDADDAHVPRVAEVAARAGAELEVDPDDPQLGDPRTVRHGPPLTFSLRAKSPCARGCAARSGRLA